jgi:hypothetical protein
MENIQHGTFNTQHPSEASGGEWGGQRDSNPQQQAPQAWTLPLSYGHQPEGDNLRSRHFAVKHGWLCGGREFYLSLRKSILA